MTPASPGPTPARRETILVVDDNEANRNLARAALEDEGYTVVLAPGGEAGVTAFSEVHPDCVLLDVRMPEVDGFEACSRIRSLPGGAETPVLFLTALRDVDTFDRALAAGAEDFLTKPVRPGELVVRVDTAVKMRRMRAELREHYDLLKHQRDDLLRVQLQKERLMSFVIHDLKNPVNSMDLNAQLLLRDRSLSERSRESVAQIRQDARHLVRLIMNLLDVAKADEGKLVAQRAAVALPPFVAEILDELRMAAEARRVRLEPAVSVPEANLDEDLFRRVLANLVENCVRHSPQDGVVTVSAREVEGALQICVSDQGPGVPDPLKLRIFDPFVQAESEAARTTRSGRGLGLAFCRLAVEAHEGRIWVEDGAPGAIFCVRIPHA